MIGLHQVAKILKDLAPQEVKVLQAMEDLAARFEYAPVEEIAKKAKLDSDDVLFRLGRLNKFGLTKRRTEHYLGYRLAYAGYDVLALHELAARDVIVSIGQPYGVGKEASVYRALNSTGEEVAVKFLSWGRSSFRQVRRLRTVQDDKAGSWITYRKYAAEREFRALRILNEIGVKVPQPIALNRHVLVMSQIEGALLLDITSLDDPKSVLKQIIDEVKLTYQKANLVHGDLSEYNIFVDDDEQVTLFDWPQWQPISHPNALWLLKRDLSHILKFFKRRFHIIRDLDLILDNITSTRKDDKNDPV